MGSKSWLVSHPWAKSGPRGITIYTSWLYQATTAVSVHGIGLRGVWEMMDKIRYRGLWSERLAYFLRDVAARTRGKELGVLCESVSIVSKKH